MPVVPRITIASVDAGTDVITTAAVHGLSTGHMIGVAPEPQATLPTAAPALSVASAYFVHVPGTSSLTLHTTPADAAAGSNAVALINAGTGTIELYRLSVRERIERQLRQDVIASLGIDSVNVQRWDPPNNRPIADANEDLPVSFVVMEPDDEQLLDENDEDVAAGFETQVLPMTLNLYLTIGRKPTGMSLANWATMWLARIRDIVQDNPHRTETSTGLPLAVDTRIVATFVPPNTGEERDQLLGSECEIRYRHPEGDPYTPG